MPREDPNLFRGTVIQRSFVPREVGAVLNIASVPLSEMYFEEFEDRELGRILRQITSEVLAIPEKTILDDIQYQKLCQILAEEDYSEPARGLPSILWHQLLRFYREDAGSSREMEIRKDRYPLSQFSSDLFCLMASPSLTSTFPLVPFYGLPLRYVTSESIAIRELSLSSEALQTGVSCFSSGKFCDAKVAHLVEEIHHYEIPLALSPRVRGDSLLKLIENGKKLCLAPMIGGGTIGLSQLGQGEFVAALLTAGTGSGMTLIFIGTLAVGDLLVRHMMARRPENKSKL